MPTSEEHAGGGSKEKIQSDPKKRPGGPEKVANRPVNHNLDFKINVMQKGWVVVEISLSL